MKKFYLEIAEDEYSEFSGGMDEIDGKRVRQYIVTLKDEHSFTTESPFFKRLVDDLKLEGFDEKAEKGILIIPVQEARDYLEELEELSDEDLELEDDAEFVSDDDTLIYHYK